jgi:hypothetical protein
MLTMMSDDDDGEKEDDHYGSGGTWFVVAVGDGKVTTKMFVSLYVYI